MPYYPYQTYQPPMPDQLAQYRQRRCIRLRQPPKVSRHTVTAIFTRRLQAKTHPPSWTSLTASCPPSVSQRPGLTATFCAKSETYKQSPAC